MNGKEVIARSFEVIFRYFDIDFAFEIKFFLDSLTSLGEPVEPEVVNNNARSWCSAILSCFSLTKREYPWYLKLG